MKVLTQTIFSLAAMVAVLGISALPAWAGQGNVTSAAVPFTNDSNLFLYVGIAGAVVVVLGVILFVIQRKNK